MEKRILSILMVSALLVPGFIYAEDAMRGWGMPATSPNLTTEVPKEWYILEKIPTGKGLAIGVFLFQEGMPIEHIHSVFGKPKEIITVDLEGYGGTILVYPHHHFFFSKAGHLQTIKERNL